MHHFMFKGIHWHIYFI